MEKRAEPHLSNDKNAGDREEDWFQAHSTQVFLIFGSILFIITLLCLYCLTRKQGQKVLPSCMKRRKKMKVRSNRNSHRPISNASSVSGLLSLNRSRSRDLNNPNHAIVGGLRIDDEDGQGMGRMRMWQNSGREEKRLWRKTAYLSDLKHATEENSRNYQRTHGKGHFDEGFPDGFERVTRDTFYVPQPIGGQEGHRRNTTISSFGHPPTSSFYDYSESPSPYSVYDANGLVRPISTYIPYNPIPTSTDSLNEQLRFPPSVKRPITDHRRSFVSHMTNDPGYLEDLKAGSYGRKSGSYYPKSPASTYVPPRESVYSWRSYPQEESNYERDQYIQPGRYDHIENQHDPHSHRQYEPQDQNYHQYDRNQGYHNEQIQSLNPDHNEANSYLNPSPIEYEYTPKPSIDQSIINDCTAYTQHQPLPLPYSSHSPPPLENSLGNTIPSARRRHGRTPSMGSIKFPEPEPSPAPALAPIAIGDGMISPYTRSSTYSFPAPPTGEGQFEFRLSSQPQAPAQGRIDTYDHDYPSQHQYEYPPGNPPGEEEEGEVGDPYSPSRTEVNTKLNSASYYSPSLISKHSRMSTVPGHGHGYGQSKSFNSISKGFDDSDGMVVSVGTTPMKEKRNSSGPSLAKSDNPNPSPNFPPPPNLCIATTSSTLSSDHKDHITTSSSSGESTISTMSKKIQRIKPPSLLKSTLPPKSPKSPSPLRYSSTFDMDDMPVWMRDDVNEAGEEPVPKSEVKI
ncbi:uncharacterized protein L199_003556 [Kwoniella botswanensis]|uniref:uncharacterized protein n=1 Tax=Kwoniella botswanensis TaxID=1268659 RepID=UPI00315DB554